MIPNLKEIFDSSPVGPKSPFSGAKTFNSIGAILTGALDIVLYVAFFLAFFWLIWGAFQYMMAQGKKEDLAKAREKLKWAIIGLIVIFASFTLTKFASEIFPPKGGLPF